MKDSKAQVNDSQNKQLYQKLKNLEQEYCDTYKRVKPRSQFLKCSTGVGSSYCSEYSSIITSLHDQILENSPRSLMSSLQESSRKSPMSDHDEGLIWKVRNNDIAVQEILTERRAALASGKLKGRRLFEGSSSEGEDICSECFDHLCHQEISEVRSMGSYGSDDEDENKYLEKYVWISGANDRRDSYCLDSSLSGEKMGKDLSLKEGEKVERIHAKEKRRVVFGSNLCGTNGGQWMIAMAWFAVVTMALALGLITMSCNGGNFEQEKDFLIPT